MKSVIITGVSGFLGSHVARNLVNAGWKVVGVKRSSSDLSRIRDIVDQLSLFDVSEHPIQKLFHDGLNPTAILHFATEYGRGYDGVANVLQANTVFPLKLLELAIEFGVEVFINSDTCYTLEYKHLQAYTLSKKQFVQWAKQITKSIKFINLVLHHPYGPNDAESKFVPFIVRECLESRDKIPLTLGDQRKDFIYIDDVVRAVRLMLEKAQYLPAGFSEWECGSGKAIPVRQLVETVHRMTSSIARLDFGALSYRLGENMNSQADISRLRELGWKPEIDIEDGIRLTINHYRNKSVRTN